MSAPTAGLVERILALQSRRARSRPAARGAGTRREEAGEGSWRGGGREGGGESEAPAAWTLRGPGAAPGCLPCHNLPGPGRLHPASWKKEPARRFPLGGSSASAALLHEQHPWGLGLQRRPRPPAAPGARPGVRNWGEPRLWMLRAPRGARSAPGIPVPAKPAPPPASPGCEQRRCRPRCRGCCSRRSELPSKEWSRGPTTARVPGSLSLRVPQPVPRAPVWRPCPGVGRRREWENVPPSFLFRPSCDRDLIKGRRWLAAHCSGPEWWRWRWRTKMGGVLGPHGPPPRPAVGACGQTTTFSSKGLGPRSLVNLPTGQRHRQ